LLKMCEMKVLIIEDEKPAANNLIRLLQQEIPDLVVEGPLGSVKESVEWLSQHPHPDLIFLDINLTDGPSFEIFGEVDVKTPIIFCTAYDQYALKAFKLNSVDYLLKPLDPEELSKALQKFRERHVATPPPDLEGMIRDLIKPENKSKQRFVIKVGDQLKIVKVPEVSFFVSSGKDTFLQNQSGRQLPIDQSLDKLEPQLPNEEFFRINRNYLVRLESIKEVRTYSNSRLKLVLHQCDDPDILVSRDRTASFKSWLAGE
jgi:DNA-binding LytR/AlgR family response regulator